MAPHTPASGQPSPTLSTSDTIIVTSDECKTCRDNPREYPDNAAADVTKPCHGWPELVQVMVKYPCFECFSAFRDLNIKSLLYYQAQLTQLREDLHKTEWGDHNKGGDRARLCANVNLLGKNVGKEQLDKVKEIREVLKEYSKD
jgi:hypothetical protein